MSRLASTDPRDAGSRADQNRRLVEAAFGQFAAGNHDILTEVIAERFVEHSPGNPSGREAFVEFIRRSAVADAQLELRRTVADQDYVVLHYLMRAPGSDRGDAVVDIWRIEDGMIVEHWDVVQAVPDPRETPNGML